MRIDTFECFGVSHTLSPRTGPSIAYSTTHAYVVLKLTDGEGNVGWGETYLAPGVFGTVEDTLGSIVGSEGSRRELLRQVRWVAGGLEGGGFAASAISIAIEDLWARSHGISVAESLGGPVRERVRMYAASGGYVEGRRPGETWPEEVARVRDAGFTALKLRIGRYPIAEEAPLLERLRSDLPDDFDLLADGNAAYTFKEAVRVGRVLEDLRFVWYEEPMEQRSGYVGYERLAGMLDIELAGGEGVMTRTDARHLLERNAVDIVQPDPVICGGVGEVVAIAELGQTFGVVATPHTSNSAIGIAAAMQALACLPDRTRSPSTPDLLLEYGVDENPFRRDLLATPMDMADGWMTIPDGPGLGIDIDEERIRGMAVRHAAGAS